VGHVLINVAKYRLNKLQHLLLLLLFVYHGWGMD